jgi:hypothetical protein
VDGYWSCGRKALVLVVFVRGVAFLFFTFAGSGMGWELVVMTFNEGNDYGGFKDIFSSI